MAMYHASELFIIKDVLNIYTQQKQWMHVKGDSNPIISMFYQKERYEPWILIQV